MRFRTIPLLALLLVPAALPAQDRTKTPTLTLRLKSLDDVVADLRHLADQAGRGEEAKQFEKLLKSMTGEQGLEGLDTTRPIGLYASIGAQGIDSKVVLMLPIAREKAFLDTLARLNIKPEKDKNGIYEFQPEGSPLPAYFRFTNGYLYGTIQDKGAIADKVLLKPEAVLPAKPADTFALALDLSNFSTDLRDVVIGQFELRLADLKEKKPGETKAQHAFRASVMEDGVAFLKTLLTDSNYLTLRFNVDRKANDVSLSFGLSGKEGSDLAKTLAALGDAKSVTAGIVGADSATASRVNYQLPRGWRKDLGPVIDEGLTTLLASVKEKEARELLKPVLDAVAPTLKEAKVDAALDFRGPSAKELYTVVGAVGVKDGAGVEKSLKAALAKLPDDVKAKVREKLSVDAGKAGDISLHRLSIEKDLDAETRKNLGENPLWFAIRDDALFFAIGEHGEAALKGALGTKPTASPIVQLEMSMARMAPLMVRDQKQAPKAAKIAFAQGKGDKISISLEAGKEFRIRLGMKGEVLRFFAELDRLEKEGQKDQ